MVRKEVALADRVIGFKWWGYTEYGAQAIDLLEALGPELDEGLLRRRVAAEDAEDALDALLEIAVSGQPIDHGVLEETQAGLRKVEERGRPE